MTKLKPCNRTDDGRFGIKHGLYGTRLYHIWNGMMGRCCNPNNKDYESYGGRGITVFNDWKNSENFFGWALNNGYNNELTLDRIDTNNGYCPDNCRWISKEAQQRNKRNNRIIEYNGQKRCVAEWSEITGISKSTIVSRLRHGWTAKETLTIKPSHKNSLHRSMEQEGEQ